MLQENKFSKIQKHEFPYQNNIIFSQFNGNLFDSKIGENEEHLDYTSEQKHLLQKQKSNINNDDGSIYIKTGWTHQQQEQLYKLHDQIGNKWAILANKIQGRTDNCVKNHFYSKLRKAMRKLNKYIHDFYKRQFKEIKISAIYKIVQGNQEKHKIKTCINKKTSNYCQDLKNRLLRFSDDNEDFEMYQEKPEIKKMIKQVVDFNKNYKRQNKRQRKRSVDAQWSKNDLKKKKKQQAEYQNENEQFYSSQQEDQDDHYQPVINIQSKRKSLENFEKKQSNKNNNKAFSSSNIFKKSSKEASQFTQVSLLPIIPIMKPSLSRIQMQQQQGIENLLRTAGMMQDDHQMPMLFMKKDFSIISKFSGRPLSQNHIDHDAFFDQSQFHQIGKSNGFNPFQYMRQHQNDFE